MFMQPTHQDSIYYSNYSKTCIRKAVYKITHTISAFFLAINHCVTIAKLNTTQLYACFLWHDLALLPKHCLCFVLICEWTSFEVWQVYQNDSKHELNWFCFMTEECLESISVRTGTNRILQKNNAWARYHIHIYAILTPKRVFLIRYWNSYEQITLW